jgi:hypothetical protein
MSRIKNKNTGITCSVFNTKLNYLFCKAGIIIKNNQGRIDLNENTYLKWIF